MTQNLHWSLLGWSADKLLSATLVSSLVYLQEQTMLKIASKILAVQGQ